MCQTSPEAMECRPANIQDQKAILAITEGEELWDGLDYLPYALGPWLEEANDRTSARRNYVFLLDQRIMGFASVYIQGGGSVASIFAYRVCKNLRGKGYGKQVIKMLDAMLVREWGGLTTHLSAVRRHQGGSPLPKEYSLLVKRDAPVFKTSLAVLQERSWPKHLMSIDRYQFATLLSSQVNVDQLLEAGTLHINWIPILPITESDIEFAVRKAQAVLLEGSVQQPISFSVLTLPFPVPNGKTRASIDIFPGKDIITVRQHLFQQLGQLTKTLQQMDNHQDCLVTLFLPSSLLGEITTIMEEEGLPLFQESVMCVATRPLVKEI